MHLNSGSSPTPPGYIYSPAYAASVMPPAPVPHVAPPTMPSTVTSTPARSIYNSRHNASSSSIMEPVDSDEEEDEKEERDNTTSTALVQTPAPSAKRAASQQDFSNLNKCSQKSGSEALYSLAIIVGTLAASIVPPQSTLLTTPEQCTKAIQTAEEEEEGYSDHEYASIGWLLSKGTNSVTYLAFKWPVARSAWLRAELHRQQLEE